MREKKSKLVTTSSFDRKTRLKVHRPRHWCVWWRASGQLLRCHHRAWAVRVTRCGNAVFAVESKAGFFTLLGGRREGTRSGGVLQHPAEWASCGQEATGSDEPLFLCHPQTGHRSEEDLSFGLLGSSRPSRSNRNCPEPSGIRRVA